MTGPLTGVVACDLCGHPTCVDCQPDAVTPCADDVTVHCASCAADCLACLEQYAREQATALRADAQREEATR